MNAAKDRTAETAAIDAKVTAQHSEFLRELPNLLRGSLRGRWIVWLDGIAKKDFGTESEATDWLLDNTAFDSGAIVVCVEEQRPVLLSAAAAVFRLGRSLSRAFA